jgi:ankyrin repeat protein
MATLLLEKGADIDALFGLHSPLHVAVLKGYMLDYLIDHGATIDLRNSVKKNEHIKKLKCSDTYTRTHNHNSNMMYLVILVMCMYIK